MVKSLLVVWRGGETGEVRLAWYGGDFWVRFLGCGYAATWYGGLQVSDVVCSGEISLLLGLCKF